MALIKNTLELIVEHWSDIIIIIGLLLVIGKKIKVYMAKSNDEKIELAWNLLSEKMLGFVSEAEVEWGSETGKIKRSIVIDKVFAQFPILAEITDKETVIKRVDELIDEALVEMRKILTKEN